MPRPDYHTVEYVRQCFDYVDGKLIWKNRPREHFSCEMVFAKFQTRYAGLEAGCTGLCGRKSSQQERRIILLDRHRYFRSILVWVYHHGEWPTLEVDHKDTDSMNDRIENLRLATSVQNKANQGKKSTNTSGYKGIDWRESRKKFRARLNGRSIGHFDTIEEACVAYKLAVIQENGEFARLE